MIEKDNRPLSERTAASIGDSESARGGGGRGGENGREERDWWRVMSWTSPPTPAGSTVSCRCRLLSDVARLVFVYIQELVLSEMVSCLARPNDILLIQRHLVWSLSNIFRCNVWWQSYSLRGLTTTLKIWQPRKRWMTSFLPKSFFNISPFLGNHACHTYDWCTIRRIKLPSPHPLDPAQTFWRPS